MSTRKYPRAVLFDLDGTLVDSAPDMVAAMNLMLREFRREPMTLDALRPHVSRGSRAMLAAAFPELDLADREAMVGDFLDTYERVLGQHCVPFDGIEALLGEIEAEGGRWGIVTNKPMYLAEELIPMLGWEERCGILLGGDSLAERKPHPMPLLHAAKAIEVEPRDCVYVGDDERDIAAARAAGMPSVVALWGYRLPGDDPVAWGGDAIVERSQDLRDAALWARLLPVEA
jgi:N-acetyl-D-muramate 6-phosphate phosphatase